MKTFVFSSFILFSLFLFGCGQQEEYATKGDIKSLKSSVDSLRADCAKKTAVKIRPKKFVEKKEFSTLEKRVETLEEKLSDLDEKNKSEHQDLANAWQNLDARVSQNSDDISDMKVNVAMNSEKVGSLEKRADLADKRIDANEKEIKTVRESMWDILGKEKPTKKKPCNDCPPGWQE